MTRIFKKSTAVVTALILMILLLFSVSVPAKAASGTLEVALNSSSMASGTYFTDKHNINVAYSSAENAVGLSSNGSDDPYVTFKISKAASVSANTYKYVVVKYKIPSSVPSYAGETQFFWSVGGQGVSEANSTRFYATRSGKYEYQIIDLSQAGYWNGNLSQIRIDPFAAGTPAGSTFYLASLYFCITKSDAQQITQGGGSSVHETTSSGLGYTASGYSNYAAGSYFKFKSDLSLKLDDSAASGSFNRMRFFYTSNQPLKMTAVYTQGSQTISDLFYLNAGTNTEFSCVNKSYLNGTKVSKLSQLYFEPCNGSETTFYLSNIKTENISVYGNSYSFSNGKFSVTVQLNRGGGISAITDSSCPVSGISNLINSHDTGRMVQQSYYGTASSSQYSGGTYNGQAWNYNPVQGGDQYNNSSRLIDISVSQNSVYIKAQPQDWALNNHITPSYMENTYTIKSDHIQVDNTFTDYAGYSNPVCDQELPAFYTISYLDKFVFYNGSKPWTGAALTEKPSLNFWGDPQYAADCRFSMNSGNSETWCAWVSSASNYGIGVFTPDVTQLLAGRYKYNGTKTASADATNYVAPLKRFNIVSYQPRSYSYYIATGSTEQIRNIFYSCRNVPAPAVYTVKFQSNGGSAVASQNVTSGNKVSRPADPTKKCCAFGGWYTDSACTKAYDFNTAVSGNFTLYAKWTDKHTLSFVKAVSPSCTKSGNSAYYTCSVCGKWFSDSAGKNEITNHNSVVIAATGHKPGAAQHENEVPATCSENGSYDEVVRCTVCNEIISSDRIVTPVTAHKWDEPVWEWADDYGTAAATFICGYNPAHTSTVEAVVESEISSSTCEGNGSTTYTASVIFEGVGYSDTLTIPGNGALGHDYVLTSWEWTDDYSEATAFFTCTRDDSHKMQIKAYSITGAVTEASCEEDGYTLYTAEARFDGQIITDSKAVPIPAAGHTPGGTEYENEVAATCNENGSCDEVVRCRLCNEIISSDTVIIPATGHKWALSGWEWAGDYSAATATFICGNDETHITSVEALVGSEIIPATGEGNDMIVYTARASFEGVEYTDTKTVTGDAGALQIISQPENTNVPLGGEAVYEVTAINAESYQWYYSKNGSNWYKSTAAGNTSPSLCVTVKSNTVDNIYRCMITGRDGSVQYTDNAFNEINNTQLNVTGISCSEINENKQATLTVTAENAESYQWYYSKDGSKWYKSSAAATAADDNSSSSLTVTVKTNTLNNIYRCLVTGIDGTKAYSDSMPVSGVPFITAFTANGETVTGGEAIFSVNAVNADTYQWYYSKDGGTKWYKSNAAGADTDTLRITVKASNDGMLYRCKVTASSGFTATSDTGMITVI